MIFRASSVHSSITILALLAVDSAAVRAPRQATTPHVQVVPFPSFQGAHAIWGATGQDSRGRLWFGVETGGITPASAHLLEYTPAAKHFVDRGNVVDELRRAGLLRPGAQQAKIHSRIVESGRYLYFASMDETGEKADGSQLPIWGGHLWRISLSTNRWEHLLATPEALIAVGAGGRSVYALGYFGHVLVRYDTQSGRTSRVEIGSIDGHISRNLIVDHRGHVYVPRLTVTAAGPTRGIAVALVELDESLREVQAVPIATPDYLSGDGATGSHGIVGLQEMIDGTVYFTTHTGRLFRIEPPSRHAAGAARDVAARISLVGWIHPDGASYSPSLFTSDGSTRLMSVGQRNGGPWEWITCAVPVSTCQAATLDMPVDEHPRIGRMLLYGSSTRDAGGGYYVAGIASDYQPVILRIDERPGGRAPPGSR